MSLKSKAVLKHCFSRTVVFKLFISILLYSLEVWTFILSLCPSIFTVVENKAEKKLTINY